MLQSYSQKIIESGYFVEYYNYENPVYRGYAKKRSYGKRESPKEDGEKSQFSLCRTRGNLRRLVNSNPELKKFVTLTFRDSVQSISYANYEFMKFIQRLKYNYVDNENFKYISTIEFQKRGVPHYHVIADLPFIDAGDLFDAWGNGFVKINLTGNEDCDNVGAYVAKYLSKDCSDKRMFNQKKYFCSRNLKRPVVIKDDKLVYQYFQRYAGKLGKLKELFSKEFLSDYVGKIEYTQFRKFDFAK